MSFLSPIAALIAAGALIPPLLLLYLLKQKRRPLRVSSTLLWRKAIDDMHVNAPFQKLRKNLLLLLQLFILAALLFALARPVSEGITQTGMRVAIVVDSSGSMSTKEDDGSRLQLAKDAAIELVNNAKPDTSIAVIRFSDSATIVQPWTDDRSQLRRAIDEIKPTDHKTQLDAVYTLLEPIAAQQEARGSGILIYILSDGRVHNPALGELKGAQLRYVPIGSKQTEDNVGIVAIDAKRDYRDEQAIRLYVRLSNTNSKAVNTNLTVTVDDQVMYVEPCALPAATDEQPGSASFDFSLTIPAGALVQCEIDREDRLDSDNRAAVHIAPPARLSVLLVSEGNPFIRRAVNAAGASYVVRISPDAYEQMDAALLRRDGWDGGQARAIDVVIFDRYELAAPPPVDSISFGGIVPIDGLSLIGARDDSAYSQSVLDWDRRHPLLDHVSLDAIEFVQPGRLQLPEEADLLATGTEGPLMAAAQVENVRHIVTSFDLYKTNWPMQVSFPVFVSNALQWLAVGKQGQAGNWYHPGQAAVLRAPVDVKEVEYDGPVALEARIIGPRMVTPAFPRAGLYVAQSAVEPSADVLAVNLADVIESDIRVADQIASTGNAITATTTAGMVRRERWRWFAWAALGVLLIEWLVYVRRWNI